MAGPFDNMNAEFTRRLQSMIAASGGRLAPGSGYRTIEQQVALRKANGCPDVWQSPASACRVRTAIPGSSNHNHGLAMDLVDASTGKAIQVGSEADKWLEANAAAFGLHRPVGTRGKKGYEPWHVEMTDDDGSRAHVQAAGRGAIGFDQSWQERPKPADELSSRLNSIMGVILGSPSDQAPVDAPEVLRQDETTIGGEGGQGGAPAGQAYNPKGGVEQWRALAVQALQYAGEDPSLVDVLLRRMQQESGGNPTAQNNWDSNAKKGTPSIGLMQTIMPTFQAHAGELADRGPTDPFANMVASIRYAKSRYGSVAAAYNRPGGY
jgi:D-alanyl-D-alanine carboxypeptidase/Transglycosylase SLT domain